MRRLLYCTIMGAIVSLLLWTSVAYIQLVNATHTYKKWIAP